MAYIGKGLDGQGVRQRYLFTATSGQTTFDTSDSGTGLSYSDTNYMDVYLNGVLLDPTSDYTATSGTSVVLGSGASAGDTLECVVYDVFSVFSGNFNTNVSVNGNLTADTNTLYVDSTNNRVGIGTATPTQSLDIVGAIKATVTPSNSVETSLLLSNSAGTSNANLQLNTAGGLALWSYENGGAGWQNSVTIDSSGNVGIENSNPSDYNSNANNLVVGTTSSNNGITIATGTANQGSIYFADGTSGVAVADGFIVYVHGSNYMSMGTNNTERLRIDGSGRITQPHQPAFFAYKSNGNYSGGGNITSWNGVPLNTGSNFNATTGVFTAPVAGKYFFSGRVLLNNSNSAGYYYLDFEYNGTAVSRNYKYVPASTYESFDTSLMFNLNANDTVNLAAQSGGTWYGVNSVYTQFIGRLLG